MKSRWTSVPVAALAVVAVVALTAGLANRGGSQQLYTMSDGTKMTAAQMSAMPGMEGMVMTDGLPQTVTAGGAPIAGKDPANQKQTTLGEAAGQPAPKIQTNGQVVHGGTKDNSTSEQHAVGKVRSSVAPPTVTPGQRQDGCAAGYGLAGQCVPLRAPGNKAWTCAALRTYFPSGVLVKHDQWSLDTNKNGTACDGGDKA